jgi:hypothetical protein
MRVLLCLTLLSFGCSANDGSGGGSAAGTGSGGSSSGGASSGGASSGGASSGGASSGGATGSGQVGDACTQNSDCADPPDAECFTTVGPVTFPNGYCSKACDVNSSEEECGSASCAASSLSGGQGSVTVSMCVRFCESDAECRVAEGYHCQIVLPGFGYCVP